MAQDNPSNLTWGLAPEFRALWETCKGPPDVFRFLDARPGAGSDERLDVLRIDQYFRWRQGRPLALQEYLKRLPDIATRPDLVRMLVQTDQTCRRESGALVHSPHETPAAEPSETPTQVMRTPRDDQETITEESSSERRTPPRPKDRRKPPRPGSTCDAPAITSPEDRLEFEIDSPIESFSEFSFLRPILDFARFTLLRRLGAGGMGIVFEAYDQDRGEIVALKTMRRVDPHALERFKQEFRALSDITHPNLVNLHRLFAINECWFFTMELVEGCDFLSYVRGPSQRAAEPETRCFPPTPERPEGRLPLARERATVETAGSPRFDESRLRSALSQLATGVHALHQAGKLHRDIKPTNVMVTQSGRVVLLDFGLLVELKPSGQRQPTDRQVVGTLAHMSPEQALGRTVSAASDWYSVGVILYEALTGRLPFEGDFDEMLSRKQTEEPPRPDQIVAGLPHDLVILCMELLSRDPSLRGGSTRVLDCLRGQTDPIDRARAIPGAAPLIGRSRHHQVLNAAFASLSASRNATVFVFGRTGTGKTTLLRSFLDPLIENEEAVVLEGRCYEQEWVPFKAVDSLIDTLAKYLKRRSTVDLQRLLPVDAFLLARVFPVLRGVPGILENRSLDHELPDPQELRLRAFAALRDLLFRISRETRLVLMIDDLQWGDVDSAILMAELLHDHDPFPMLFVGSFRLEDAEESRFLQTLRQAGLTTSRPAHRELAVEALSQAESRELALALLGPDHPLARAHAHLIARESQGNPLFINELVRFIQSGDLSDCWAAPGEIDLDAVLLARIQTQPEGAQRLLEIVSVSGRPILEPLAFHLAELGTEARASLSSLRSARLVRGAGPDRLDQIEIYHDRIRETVLTHLDKQTRQGHHERLAKALESMGATDPEVLADHFRRASQGEPARFYYTQAAEKASAALAFHHAAQLYRLALEQYGGTPSQDRQLVRKLGDALASSGRGAEAAEVYFRAADGASAAEKLELTRLASTQLLISGQVDEGLALLKTILGPLGLSMPSTPRRALLSLLWHRALLRLRGVRFRPRDETQVSAEDLTRIDLCWSTVAGLSVIDPILGADFQTRGLLLALHAGEPFRIARSIAMEATNRATEGIRAARHVESLNRLAEKLSQGLCSPAAEGIISMPRGMSALLLGQWKRAQTCFDLGDTLIRDHCTDVTWERDTVRNLALWALLHMGKIDELKRRWSLLIKEAHECGDLYAATTLTTFYLTPIRLAADDPSGIEREIETVMGQWTRRRFFIQHSTAFRSLLYLDLYRGDAETAWQRVHHIWPEYSRSMLLRIQMIRIEMLELRARAALALAETTAAPESLLRSARRDAQKLTREGQPWALAHAHYIQAAIAACHGDALASLHHLALAAEQYDAADMHLSGWVMRYRMGEIQGGVEGRTLTAQAEAASKNESIVSPSRWCQMMAPGFAKLDRSLIETQ